MAIGDYNQSRSNNTNGKNSNSVEGTYYSRLRIRHATNKLNLNISFRSGLMMFEISEYNGSGYNSIQSIYLSPTKATILAREIRKFKKYLEVGDIDPLKAFGVNAGMNDKITFIGFHADEKSIIKMTIGKMNGATGEILESATMELNKDYHFALEWNNIETMDVEKCYCDDIEISQIENLCDDFGRYLNGAIGYAVADLARFDHQRILNRIDPILDKLGIERRNNGGNYSGSKGSSFLDSRGSTSNHMSFENLEEQMYDEE